MNVEIFGLVKNEQQGLKTLRFTDNSISESNGLNIVRFANVMKGTGGIHKELCLQMIDMLVSGYNAALVIAGYDGTDYSNILHGNEYNGLFYEFLQPLFDKVEEEQSLTMGDGSQVIRNDAILELSIFEVTGNSAEDLIGGNQGLVVEEDAANGYYLKFLSKKTIQNPDEGAQVFEYCWSKSEMSQGSSANTTFFVTFDLTVTFEQHPNPHKSRMSFVLLPSLTGLVQGFTDNSSDIKAVDHICSSLAQNISPNRVIDYSKSAVTKLLEQELGGNCLTKVLACFNTSAEQSLQKEALRFCKNLSQVRVFPIMNDSYAQELLMQYRANVIYHKQSATGAAKEKTYLEENNQLRTRVSQLNSKLISLAEAKSQLSQQLVSLEEEKIAAARSQVEVQIENNRLRDQMESLNYELSNKIYVLQHNLELADIEKEKMRSQLNDLESDRRSAVDDFIKLKTSYMGLSDQLRNEVIKNDELTMELFNLLNAKVVLSEQVNSSSYVTEAAAFSREQERVKRLLDKLSKQKTSDDMTFYDPRKILITSRTAVDLKDPNHDYMLSRAREVYDLNRLNLDEKLASMAKEMMAAKDIARERQHQISFLNARLLTLSGENSELKTISNRLQHKLKDLSEEYKLRLVKYIEDIAVHIDHSGTKKSSSDETMAAFVNKMLKDIKSAHRNREDQLSLAAQSYKTRLDGVVRKHEELLCAYRDLRSQVESLKIDGITLGPDEHDLIMADAELQSLQQKEITRLQSEIHNIRSKAAGSVHTLVKSQSIDIQNRPEIVPEVPMTFSDLSSWSSVRKHLREFSETSLKKLEEERAVLLARNAILEEQLKESQSYIDSHLVRYKEEIVHLRRQLAA